LRNTNQLKKEIADFLNKPVEKVFKVGVGEAADTHYPSKTNGYVKTVDLSDLTVLERIQYSGETVSAIYKDPGEFNRAKDTMLVNVTAAAAGTVTASLPVKAGVIGGTALGTAANIANCNIS